MKLPWSSEFQGESGWPVVLREHGAWSVLAALANIIGLARQTGMSGDFCIIQDKPFVSRRETRLCLSCLDCGRRWIHFLLLSCPHPPPLSTQGQTQARLAKSRGGERWAWLFSLCSCLSLPFILLLTFVSCSSLLSETPVCLQVCFQFHLRFFVCASAILRLLHSHPFSAGIPAHHLRQRLLLRSLRSMCV